MSAPNKPTSLAVKLSLIRSRQTLKELLREQMKMSSVRQTSGLALPRRSLKDGAEMTSCSVSGTAKRTIKSYQLTAKHQAARISAPLLKLARKAATGRAMYPCSSVQTFSVSGTTGQVKLNAGGCAARPVSNQLVLWI